VLGDPVGIPIIEGQDFQIRLLLFLLGEDAETNLTTQVILLMGASADDWAMYEETFGRIDDTVVVYKEQTNFALGGGSTNIVGDLHNALPVQAILARRQRCVGLCGRRTLCHADAQHRCGGS
jgi:hypothetical protein